MTDDTEFESIRNHHEQPVLSAVAEMASDYPLLGGPLLADVACVALNRLPPRYIRHPVDLAFYLTEREREDTQRHVREAVEFAFQFVQARVAMRARG
ncbi:late competence development ComFB family protein [Aquabacterium sp. J223]|uniref:late competence development ComFB family protein n=1 Tax=Aquabacterium sp. J223 TaxID=2898431 RepID=UPI0021ADB11E|nr:late competence development ComFB family protein [Aquabacterium sp. J223]UUX94834.1 late competence development ComFB family protein [Aquabacterium sp. J223]